MKSHMNWSIRILVLFLLLFNNAIEVEAQSTCEAMLLPQERVVLHLDRNICLAGETVWFKAWCFLDNQIDEELSKVLYIEIFDETETSIAQEKFLLTDNKTAGSIRIPDDVPSKYYFMKAYTKYMRNFSSENFHYQQLIIVNPYIESGSIEATEVATFDSQSYPEVPQNISPTTAKSLQIVLDKTKYQPRESISFHINSFVPLTAELSTTVRLKGLGNQPIRQVMNNNKWLLNSCQEDPFCRQFYLDENLFVASSDAQKRQSTIILTPDKLQWRPENRGLSISGLVQNSEQENVTGAQTLIAVVQNTPFLYMGTTDENGAFTICLQDMEELKNLFIGTPNQNNRVLVRNDFESSHPKVTAVPLQYDSSIHHLLSFLNIHQQLNTVYPKNEIETVFETQPLTVPETNILTPDRRVALRDFIKLSTMTEVFRDITPGIALRKVDGKDNLSVFNSEEQKWYNSPLILLDNVPIFNIEELLKVDPAKIEAIEVYDSDYILGDYTIGAIISIISKTDNFAAYQWGEQVAFSTFKAFTVPQAFEQVIHLEESHYPDFKPVLYWQPNLILEKQQNSEIITVFAPDQPGMYEVLVQGYTTEGVPCMGYVTFEVTPYR